MQAKSDAYADKVVSLKDNGFSYAEGISTQERNEKFVVEVSNRQRPTLP